LCGLRPHPISCPRSSTEALYSPQAGVRTSVLNETKCCAFGMRVAIPAPGLCTLTVGNVRQQAGALHASPVEANAVPPGARGANASDGANGLRIGVRRPKAWGADRQDRSRCQGGAPAPRCPTRVAADCRAIVCSLRSHYFLRQQLNQALGGRSRVRTNVKRRGVAAWGITITARVSAPCGHGGVHRCTPGPRIGVPRPVCDDPRAAACAPRGQRKPRPARADPGAARRSRPRPRRRDATRRGRPPNMRCSRPPNYCVLAPLALFPSAAAELGRYTANCRSSHDRVSPLQAVATAAAFARVP
jgi:hypothetical protein